MATMSKVILTGSTSGKNIKVVPTATAGTIIHTAIAGSSDIDEIWLWAQNSDTSNRKLTIEFGAVATPDDLIEVTVEAESGLALIIPGLLLNDGLVVRAWASAANVILINGYVNRITA
jgi:hypothetical protein